MSQLGSIFEPEGGGPRGRDLRAEVRVPAWACGQDDGYRAQMIRATTMGHREWLLADRERLRQRDQWIAFFQRFDLLLCPAGATTAFAHNQQGERWDRMVQVNGQPQPTTTSLFWAGNIVLGRFIAGHVPPVALSFIRWSGACLLLMPLAIVSTLLTVRWMKRMNPERFYVLIYLLMVFLGAKLREELARRIEVGTGAGLLEQGNCFVEGCTCQFGLVGADPEPSLNHQALPKLGCAFDLCQDLDAALHFGNREVVVAPRTGEHAAHDADLVVPRQPLLSPLRLLFVEHLAHRHEVIIARPDDEAVDRKEPRELLAHPRVLLLGGQGRGRGAWRRPCRQPAAALATGAFCLKPCVPHGF